MVVSELMEVMIETDNIMIVWSIVGEVLFTGKIYAIPENLRDKTIVYLSSGIEGVYIAIL